MKRLFLLTLLHVPLFCIHTPQNTIIGLDLHDTYLQKTFWRYANDLFLIFSASDKKWEIFCILPQSFKIYNRAKELSKEYNVNQYVIENLCKEFPVLYGLEDELHRANAISLYEPIPAMVELISELKQAGYIIFVVSNIGLKQYCLTAEKYFQEFKLFDDYFIPHKAATKAAKPDVQFYIDLRSWLASKGHGGKTMLFIDDRQDYITGADQANKLGARIESLLFTTPQQLRKDLFSYEFLPKTALVTYPCGNI